MYGYFFLFSQGLDFATKPIVDRFEMKYGIDNVFIGQKCPGACSGHGECQVSKELRLSWSYTSHPQNFAFVLLSCNILSLLTNKNQSANIECSA